jgi:hypothetical protein
MAKYKIEIEEIYGINNGYYILIKKSWWTPWKYLKDKNKIIIKFDTRRKAQAYINFNLTKK